MNRVLNPLIEDLAADLEPVKPFKMRDGLVLVALALVAAVIAVEFIFEIWRGAFTGDASTIFWVTNGLLIVLGFAAGTTVLNMASPRVGNRHDGPKWALAMTAILPVAVMLPLLRSGAVTAPLSDQVGIACAAYGTLTGIVIALALTHWLRRGAPVSPNLAGLFTGVAAGALGSVAYGISCPVDHATHMGIWHVLPVAISGALGRVILPPMLRW